MNINIKLTNAQNAGMYGVSTDSVVRIPFTEYLYGVVAAELGGTNLEALKAQAVASRTFAYQYASLGKTITDSSSSHQAFNAYRVLDIAFHLARAAVDDTDGEVLYYNGSIIDTCAFSSCNHGCTTSSKSRWGGYRPYLIEQVDPWDSAATYNKKRGHGVGMSQMGAVYASKQGVSYRDILSFYYPGTTIVKEGSSIAQTVKASELIVIFNRMADEKWKYVAGAHKQGEVDCSGAFYYAYKQLSGYMYHGSNTMWRKYTTKKGKIGEIDLKPGMPVFKCRDWTSAQSSNGWYETSPGDVYHVGMYVGDGWVVEAQGKKTGVVRTKLSTWHMAAELVDTIYDVAEGTAHAEPTQVQCGIVNISSGHLNLRTGPSTSYPYAAKVYKGEVLSVIGESGTWYQVTHKSTTLYAHKDFVQLVAPQPMKMYTITVTVDEYGKDKLQELLSDYAYVLSEVSA